MSNDQPASLADRNARRVAAKNAAKAIEDANTPIGIGGTPTLAGHGYAERFPIHTLPQRLREHVTDIAIRNQVPVDLTAMCALGCISAFAGSRFMVRRDSRWIEPPIAHLMVVMESGAAKSPAVRELMDGVRRAQARVAVKFNEAVQEKVKELEAKRDAAVKAAQLKNTKEAMDAAKPQISAYSRQIEELTEKPPKAPRQVIPGDITPEKLCERMGKNHGTLAVIDHEGTFLRILSGEMYGGGRTGNSTVAIKGYDGDQHIQDRVREGGTVELERAVLTIFIAAQEHTFSKLMANVDLTADGFINRFLYCVPGDLVGMRQDRPSTYYADAETETRNKPHDEWWAELLCALVEYPIIGADLEDGQVIDLTKAPTFQLTRGAWKRHVEYAREFENRLTPGQPDARRLKAWGGKHVGRVLRLAALLHIANGGTVDQQITESVIEDAIVIGDWSVRQFLAAGPATGMSDGAGRIAEFVNNDERGGMLRGEIGKRVFQGRATKVQLDGYLDELVRSKKYHLYEEPTAGRKRTWVLRADVLAPATEERTSAGDQRAA